MHVLFCYVCTVFFPMQKLQVFKPSKTFWSQVQFHTSFDLFIFIPVKILSNFRSHKNYKLGYVDIFSLHFNGLNVLRKFKLYVP